MNLSTIDFARGWLLSLFIASAMFVPIITDTNDGDSIASNIFITKIEMKIMKSCKNPFATSENRWMSLFLLGQRDQVITVVHSFISFKSVLSQHHFFLLRYVHGPILEAPVWVADSSSLWWPCYGLFLPHLQFCFAQGERQLAKRTNCCSSIWWSRLRWNQQDGTKENGSDCLWLLFSNIARTVELEERQSRVNACAQLSLPIDSY